MNTPLIPVAAALAAALSVSSVLTLATGGVWNQLPEQPAYPAVRYVVRGKPIAGIADSKTWQIDAEIDVYATYEGDLAALQILDVIFGIVNVERDTAPLAAEGWTIVMSSAVNAYPVPDEFVNDQPVKRWTLPVLLFASEAA